MQTILDTKEKIGDVMGDVSSVTDGRLSRRSTLQESVETPRRCRLSMKTSRLSGTLTDVFRI
jgi:hypothetical protein